MLKAFYKRISCIHTYMYIHSYIYRAIYVSSSASFIERLKMNSILENFVLFCRHSLLFDKHFCTD